MKLKLAIATLLAFSGCVKPTQTMPIVANSERIEIKRIGIVEDDIAFGNQRGIYLIQDTKTGKEYIGISGIGISETGSHLVNGKTSVQDER